MSTEWELKFPKSSVQALTREISDHTPLFMDTGNPSSSNSHPYFKFELGWLLREGFMDMVKEIWASVQMGNTPLERWQAKIRRLRQYLRGWAKNTSGAYKKEKKALLDKLDELDKKVESIHLNEEEVNLKHVLNDRLADLLREEELKWYQRAKIRNLLEGDVNTKYFHLVASGKHRKTRIFRLEQEEGVISGDSNLKKYITNYYKNLFGPPEAPTMFLDESRTEDMTQVSNLENEILADSFTEAEVGMAIFQMKHNTAPGPDGFPVEFYQVF